jgi:cyclophilin family peptidyl-prolyl cis-trans isomerase
MNISLKSLNFAIKKINMKPLLQTLIIIFMTIQCTNTNATEPIVEIETSLGKIQIKLYNNTPLHRDNFLKLVKEDYYNGTLFHRVINNFMIQAGDPDSKTAKPGQMLGQGGPGYTIPAEFTKENYHKRGALAAARLGDQMNPKKESSGSQFYIVHGRTFSDAELNHIESSSGIAYTPEQREIYKTVGGTPHLDGGYTVFGEVISGLDVIDNIAKVKTQPGDRPVEDVVIISMKIIK